MRIKHNNINLKLTKAAIKQRAYRERQKLKNKLQEAQK